MAFAKSMSVSLALVVATTILGYIHVADGQLRTMTEPRASARAVPETESCRVSAADSPEQWPDNAGAGTFAEVADHGPGPDLITADLQSVLHYETVGDIHAYSVGTHACNLGDERVSWIAHNNQHPLTTLNMYRLAEGRFEQIGTSWVSHGFYAVSWNLCGPCDDNTDGSELGVGCSNPRSASLNGVQGNLSFRSDVNAHTGYFPYPWTAPEIESNIDRRIQVQEADLDPDLNVGARYFVEAQYIAADEAAAGNGDSNASYREVELATDDWWYDEYDMIPIGQTQREQPAIRAWQDTDPSVVETDVHVPGEGLFILAVKTTNLGTGMWRYAYALQNLNSDRAAGSFSVPLAEEAIVANVSFHDVDYHSGEIYDCTDWPAVIEEDAITWATDSYDDNPNANALRFATIYNFYFDVNAEPTDATLTIGLFKPGFPNDLTIATVGPYPGPPDCNNNGIVDICDVDCSAEGCEWPCESSIDCNDNGVPDECEPDCNENGIADECDILDCDGALWCRDCNGNTVPDGCEPDCDGNGIPDDCVPPPDSDGDGVNDCEDRCPYTTGEHSCTCPPFGECCWPEFSFCLSDYSLVDCVETGGVPECLDMRCRDGCLIGDFNDDGDRDLEDFAAIQNGFSGDVADPGYVPPPDVQSLKLDFNEDLDIDLRDVELFCNHLSGPR